MDNSEKQSSRDLGLSKDEIIRGYNAYLRILSNSGSFVTGNLKAFVNTESPDNRNSELTLSPLFTSKVKVGFIVAKKKNRKASDRNRIRRLLKESYRINKNLFNGVSMDTSVIFSFTDDGYRMFNSGKLLKRQDVDDDMKRLILKINSGTFKK